MTIGFSADNHLGMTSQWGLKQRRDDFLDAFRTMVADARVRTDAFIIGGDLFDSGRPPSFAVECVQEAVKAYGRPVFGIDGNHDLSDGEWLRVCGITPLCEVPVNICGRYVCGISYRRSTAVIEKLQEMADAGVKCAILVLHLAFGELNRMGAASDLSAADIMPMLKAMGTKLVLMGHIHVREEVTIDDVTFVYSGSTETCAMNEPRAKSYELVDCASLMPVQAPVATRTIVSEMVSTEEELVALENRELDKAALYSVTVSPDVSDGVKRLVDWFSAHGVLARVVSAKRHLDTDGREIDRGTGIIGLEEAIETSFPPDSEEAGLVRTILRAPEKLDQIVAEFMAGREEK